MVMVAQLRAPSLANYVPTMLGERYDAFLWFDETTAVRSLHARAVDVLEPEGVSAPAIPLTRPESGVV